MMWPYCQGHVRRFSLLLIGSISARGRWGRRGHARLLSGLLVGRLSIVDCAWKTCSRSSEWETSRAVAPWPTSPGWPRSSEDTTARWG